MNSQKIDQDLSNPSIKNPGTTIILTTQPTPFPAYQKKQPIFVSSPPKIKKKSGY